MGKHSLKRQYHFPLWLLHVTVGTGVGLGGALVVMQLATVAVPPSHFTAAPAIAAPQIPMSEPPTLAPAPLIETTVPESPPHRVKHKKSQAPCG